jgi:hypothetical protein
MYVMTQTSPWISPARARNESQDVGPVPLAIVNDHALAGLFVGLDAERPHADLRAGDLPRLHVWRPACGAVASRISVAVRQLS